MRTHFDTESEFTAALKQSLEAVGAKVLSKSAGSVFESSGWPDRFVVHRAWHGWVEMKRDERKLTAAQKDFGQVMLARRTPWVCVRYRSDDAAMLLSFIAPGVNATERVTHTGYVSDYFRQPLLLLRELGESCETAFEVYSRLYSVGRPACCSQKMRPDWQAGEGTCWWCVSCGRREACGPENCENRIP